MSRETFQIKPHEEGLPLVDVLSERFRCSKKQARVLLDARQVFVNGQRIWMAKHALKTKDVIETVRPESKSKKIEILKRAGDLIIVNKPAGTVTNGSARSLEVRLQHELENPQLCAVHRLDRDTSGCVLFAANAAAKEKMIPLFKDQKMNMVEALGVLRNHRCKVYNNGDIVPFEAKKKQNMCYDLIKVKPQAYNCDALPTLW